MRKYGLSMATTWSPAEVVTADGGVVRASSASEPELLWGLRGGGGNFGIVTRFEFRLHPVDTVVGGLTMFPIERGADVLRTYRGWADGLDDEFHDARRGSDRTSGAVRPGGARGPEGGRRHGVLVR